ncbi:MurR/RpiR family transcriptional regulator [Burkholderia mayonis]|uniref:RpiR family transcriptional regulator n=1 Tax=Burkholderia mayonis TaxID=1385591 RepID=A0A1B4FUC4_9BURK|nr:MurR/RpiR family transcriptional regulator [Burkholderia mayonis]AOJ07256.1 RpiR family transcriptional regulator [Burkholderia mayonis]KVE47686.1 RpiR family transcriptional regulator [Burkholderia mayonis]
MKKIPQTLLYRLRAALQTFSPAEKRVAMTLIADYPITGLKTLVEIANAAGVSPATVSRFAETLGFLGFPDFQRALHEDVAARFSSPGLQFDKTPERSADSGRPHATAKALGKLVTQTVASVERRDVELLIEKLTDPKRTVYFLGGRHSGSLARYFQQQLHHLRSRTVLFDSVNADAIDALIEFDTRSVLIAFDFRRYQHDTTRFTAAASARRAHVAVFTDPYMSPAVKHASQVFLCRTATTSPFDSYASGLALIDFLTQELATAFGETGHERVSKLESVREEFGLEYVLRK